MLTLPTRPAKIGGSINTRTEKHGDDDVAALDIPLEFLLEPDELCAILKTEDASARLFTGAFNHELKRVEFQAPAIGTIKSLALDGKIEGARVLLGFDSLNGRVDLELVDAKVAKVRLELVFGGRTRCSCSIQTTPDFDQALMQLFAHMGGDCELTITSETWGSQGELELGGAE